jgi:hypothetical protein
MNRSAKLFLASIISATIFARNPFYRLNSKLEVLAHGIKPKPFILAIQQNKPVVFWVNDTVNDLFTIKDINKNSYSLVDSYGNEYNYSFV